MDERQDGWTNKCGKETLRQSPGGGPCRLHPQCAAETRGGTRGRRQQFPSMSGGMLREHTGKAGRLPGPVVVSAAVPGRDEDLGALALGASGALRKRSGVAGVALGRGAWGPGLGGPASGPRVRAAARGPSASVVGTDDSVRWRGSGHCGSQLSLVLVPGLTLICVSLTHFIPLGFSAVVCRMGRIVSD